MSVIRYYNIAEIGTVMLPGVVGGLAPRSAVTVVQDAWDADRTFLDVLTKGTAMDLYAVSLDGIDSVVPPDVTQAFTRTDSSGAIDSEPDSGSLHIQYGNETEIPLPAASEVAAGWSVRVFFDGEHSVGGTLDITADQTEPDTIDAGPGPHVLTLAAPYVVFTSDGVSDWTTSL